MGELVTRLCFHGVGPVPDHVVAAERQYWVPTPFFLHLLDELVGLPGVELSFDDGNSSDVETALPALSERGMTAGFFALAGRLHAPGSLGADDLRSLVAAGMSVGSHGMEHVPWRRLDAEAQHRELTTARDLLADAAGVPITEVALPFGQYDRRTLDGLRSRSYRHVYSSDRLPANPSRWFQPRYSVRQGDDVGDVAALAGRARRQPALLARAKVLVKSYR
jgi:peptidoglycan/xylan/chitin deacetylase (PgdA/CDA1 family)